MRADNGSAGGHSDSSGIPLDNPGLSQRRATVVRPALVERGVLAGALVVMGFGDQRPVACRLIWGLRSEVNVASDTGETDRWRAAPVAAAPVAAPVMAAGAPGQGVRPAALAGPRGGKADDLKLVKGIGPKQEVLCNKVGFWHFDQMANRTPAELAWVDENLAGFKGRVMGRPGRREMWRRVNRRVRVAGPENEGSEETCGAFSFGVGEGRRCGRLRD